jgi:hypothetical protein
MFGNPETTPGGKALKFYASVRLDIRKTAQIKKGEDVLGARTKVKVVKNKVAAPFKSTEFDIMYGEGISKEGELLALGEKFKLVTKTGTSYSFGEEKLGRGYDASRTFLKENPKIAKELEKQIPYYQLRYLSTPGIAGWAQLHFRYGSSVEDAYQKLQYDIYYIKHRSIWLDMTIILKTIKRLFLTA